MPASKRTVGLSPLAKLLDTTPRNITGLTASGILTRATDDDGKELRGRYPEKAITEYVRYLNNKNRANDASEVEHNSAKLRKTISEAKMSEHKVQIFERKLCYIEDVEFIVTNMITFFKQRMLAIPSRISRLLIGKKKFREIFSIIDTEIKAALRELSAPSRQMIEQQAAARLASQGADMSSSNGKDYHQAKATGAEASSN